jgi:hypothetical protein
MRCTEREQYLTYLNCIKAAYFLRFDLKYHIFCFKIENLTKQKLIKIYFYII